MSIKPTNSVPFISVVCTQVDLINQTAPKHEFHIPLITLTFRGKLQEGQKTKYGCSWIVIQEFLYTEKDNINKRITELFSKIRNEISDLKYTEISYEAQISIRHWEKKTGTYLSANLPTMSFDRNTGSTNSASFISRDQAQSLLETTHFYINGAVVQNYFLPGIPQLSYTEVLPTSTQTVSSTASISVATTKK